MNEIRKYGDVLAKQGKTFPDSFALRQFVWAQVEHDPITQTARGAYFAAKQAAEQKDNAAAENLFAQSIDAWGKVLNKYPSIIGDKSICREMVKAVGDYLELLESQGKELPKEMPLKNVIDRWGKK